MSRNHVVAKADDMLPNQNNRTAWLRELIRLWLLEYLLLLFRVANQDDD